MEPTSTKVPAEIWAKIIPSRNLSVSDLQNFPLPELAISKSLALPQPLQNILSRLPPNITDVEEIILLPTPSEALLKSLLKCPEIRQSQSFICEHLWHGGTQLRIPLWTIGYWLEVLRIHPIKLLWASAQRNLDFIQKELLADNSMDLIKQVSSVLSKLSWKDNIKGFPAQIPPEHLTSYLTQEWLSDEHENQMLHLLQKELALRHPKSNTNITTTYFFQILSELYRAGTYDALEGASWIRRKSQDFATGVYDVFATIVNINSNHWVPIVVDFKASKILYGNSIGGVIDEGIEEILTWWTYHHTGVTFTKTYLPITRQRDGFSCGLLAWNALATYLLPDIHSLFNALDMAKERLKIFLQVIEQHDQVGGVLLQQ
jgi:Ulp1 protease family, C-terminal catalytic domain